MRKFMTQTKQTIAVILSLVLMASTILGQLPAGVRVSAAGYGISNPRTDSSGVTTWDCIWFGNYWQSNETTKEPIKWRVLSVNGDDAFLLADQNLDCQPYNTEYTNVTWETCTLRTWLNSTFYQNAFSAAEQSAIRTTTVVNEDNPTYGTEGGNNTQDKVYLLSIAEASNAAYGFNSEFYEESETRYAKNTEYAKKQGASTSTSDSYAGNGWWWLRSPGNSSSRAAHVNGSGSGSDYGLYVDYDPNAVRPALHINLKASSDAISSTWSKAGTVSSAGGSTGGATAGPTLTPTFPTEKPAETTKEKRYKKAVADALPDIGNLGSAELKGPEIQVGKSKFNLFKTRMNVSLPLFGKNHPLKITVDEKANTAEVLLGIEGDIKSDPDDPYWKETYRQVKSLVQACGKNVDTTKLWNRFSKLRGKLKKISGDAVFGVSGNAAGYIKLQLDESGNIQNIIEGGIAAGLSASGKVKTPLWWIVYSEFGVSGSVDGKLFLKAQNTKAISINGELGLAVKPSVALGADALVADVKGGLEGKLAGKVKFPWTSFRNSVSAELTGKVFIKVDTAIPGLSFSKDWNFPKLELYPDFGKITKQSAKLVYSRSRKASGKEQKAMSPLRDNAISSISDSLVYENAKPQMTKLPDGRILLTYLDDTVSGAGGQTTLMYRIYENGSWGEAAPVNFTGRLDTAAKVKVHQDRVWLLYENSDVAITEDMEAAGIAGHMKLYAVEFLPGTDRFLTPVLLGENSPGYKYGYDFMEGEGELSCVWAENNADDILLDSGSTKIYQSSYQNGNWSVPETLAEDTAALPEFAAGFQNGTRHIAYAKEGKLYIDGEKVTVADGNVDRVIFAEGNFFFRMDGQLYRYDGEDSKPTGIMCSADYRIVGTDVYWTEQDNFKSELFRQSLQGTPGAVAVTDDGGYIGSFCVLPGTEQPVLVYTVQQVADSFEEGGSPYGLTLLKCKEDLSRVQGEVTNVAYDILSFTPGETNEIAVTVANTGTEVLDQLVVTVSDREGNVLCEKALTDSLEPGTCHEYTVPVPVSANFSQGDIIVSLKGAEEFGKEASLRTELETSSADLEVTKKNDDVIVVTNKAGQAADHVTVRVTDPNKGETLLYQNDTGTLLAGGKKEISLAPLWEKAAVSTLTQKKYLNVEVTQEQMEYELWNNTMQLEKAVKKAGTDPSQKTDKTKDPGKKPEQTAPSYPAKNTKLKDKKGNTYTVTRAGKTKGEVSYTVPKNKKLTSVSIPATVKLKGITYKVTSIKANAFKKCKRLKKATIGKNIKTIGKNAFYGCVKLKNITVKTTKLTKKSVGSKAFAKLHKRLTVKVPKKKRKAYKKILRKKGVTGKKQTIK